MVMSTNCNSNTSYDAKSVSSEDVAFDPRNSETLSNEIARKAAKEEAKVPVQVVDSNTNPEDVAEIKPGKPIALILSKEERPTEDVFQNIVNFRDVGGNANADSGYATFKTLNFFRSGRLDDADTADLTIMKEKYNIKCVIDLRSETEGKMGEDLINTFPASVIMDQLKPEEILNPAGLGPKDPIVSKRKETGENAATPTRVTYFINFAGRKFRYNSVWKPLNFRSKWRVVYLMGSKRRCQAIMYIGQKVIQPPGLLGLNKNFIDYCGKEIASAIRILSKPKHFPVLVHCTQGKDRTGLVVALTLSICGVSEENIVKDYGRTQKGLARQRDVMVEEMRKTGLDSTFSDAPPEIMVQALDYIKQKYGSPIEYLKKNGLTEEEMSQIRRNLLV